MGSPIKRLTSLFAFIKRLLQGLDYEFAMRRQRRRQREHGSVHRPLRRAGGQRGQRVRGWRQRDHKGQGTFWVPEL